MLAYILFFTFIGSIFSLIGGFLLLKKKTWSEEFSIKLVSFAAGVLLTSAFFDLLPEALEKAETVDYFFIPVFVAIILFFFLERSFFWFHHHQDECYHHKIKASVYLILLGDSVHNFIDGVAIAASFMVSFPLGVATSLAVAAHEIPQEIADFSIMLAAGMSKKRVVFFNLLSALTAFLGAIITYGFYSVIKNYLWVVIAFTGGMFIYIATADLIPEIHRIENKHKGFSQILYFISGIVTTLLVIFLINSRM